MCLAKLRTSQLCPCILVASAKKRVGNYTRWSPICKYHRTTPSCNLTDSNKQGNVISSAKLHFFLCLWGHLYQLLSIGEAAFRGLLCVFQLKAENMHNEEKTAFSCMYSSLNVLWLQ